MNIAATLGVPTNRLGFSRDWQRACGVAENRNTLRETKRHHGEVNLTQFLPGPVPISKVVGAYIYITALQKTTPITLASSARGKATIEQHYKKWVA